MESGKIPHQLHEQPDISHRIQQVLVLKLLRLLVPKRLHERSRALARATDHIVGDHFAVLALDILHLVRNDASVNHLDQPSLNLVDLQLLVTQYTHPTVLKRFSKFTSQISRVKTHITTDVKILCVLTVGADNVRDYQY